MNTVLFDVGETLVDETRQWASWAEWLEVPTFTLYGVLGGLAARGQDHRRFAELLKPESTFEEEWAAKEAAGLTWAGGIDLYPDAVPCLHALHEEGWRLIVGGNQPATFERLVEELALPVDAVVSSGGLGVEKPSPGFFVAAAAVVGVDVTDCVHVGDRVDNDVVAARAAGMTPVHVRRGPWGVLHAHDPAIELQVTSLMELPSLLHTLR
ncbi:MAG: HAD-superfamily hydrolase, subfamily variant 1 [Frankiales bacterium]|nr:HAD-superfamily hydrolase, subfamily variant 1 [Frankiales bacterium]